MKANGERRCSECGDVKHHEEDSANSKAMMIIVCNDCVECAAEERELDDDMHRVLAAPSLDARGKARRLIFSNRTSLEVFMFERKFACEQLSRVQSPKPQPKKN